MKKKIVSILFTFILIFAIKNTCNAANAEILCGSDATVGEKINISVSGSAQQWNLELKVNGETIAQKSEVDNVDGNKNISFSGTYTPTEEGELTVTLSGNVKEATDGSSITSFESKSISVKAKGTNSNDSSNNTSNTTSKSSEAGLKDLGITPNDFKGFKKDTYTYNVEVPNNVEKVNVYAKPVDSKAKVSGTGNVALKEGKNSVNVVVTAEDGSKKTYTINITRNTASEEEKESDSEAGLKNLGIKPKEYDFSGFKKDVLEYSVEVANEVSEVEVYAEAISAKATVKGTGKLELKEGKNTVNVEVTAEDGTQKVYVIEITRVTGNTKIEEDKNKEDDVFGLSQLEVNNFELNPKFDTKIYEYKLELTEDIDSLDIKTKTNNEKNIVEIVGNENLQQGENVITILVTNEETDKVATYQIIVNKNVSAVAGVDWLKPSTWGLKEIIIVGVAILLITILVVIIVIKIKLKKGEKRKFPGAEELDRALTEHQELTKIKGKHF